MAGASGSISIAMEAKIAKMARTRLCVVSAFIGIFLMTSDWTKKEGIHIRLFFSCVCYGITPTLMSTDFDDFFVVKGVPLWSHLNLKKLFHL